jgi:hypothetical protein
MSALCQKQPNVSILKPIPVQGPHRLPKNRHSLWFEVLPKWANSQAKIHAKIHGDGEARGRPTAAQARGGTAAASHNGRREKSSFGAGFQQNGEHDPS